MIGALLYANLLRLSIYGASNIVAKNASVFLSFSSISFNILSVSSALKLRPNDTLVFEVLTIKLDCNSYYSFAAFFAATVAFILAILASFFSLIYSGVI